jgi:Papain fold toxin 1, glutamine deamidase
MRARHPRGLRQPRNIDLSTTYAEPATYTEPVPPKPRQPEEIPPPPEQDHTVAKVAAILLAGYAVLKTAELIAGVLSLPLDVVQAAYGLANGARHKPVLRRADRGVVRFDLDGNLTDGGEVKSRPMVEVNDRELFFRAAYIVNASKRLANRAPDESLVEALGSERRYFHQHRAAQKARGEAAAQVQTAANIYGQPDEHGILVGWYRNPLLKNDLECRLADGHNFYAEQGTAIGWPGAVHSGCGCVAGTPHAGAGLVDDALKGYYRVRGVTKPMFAVRRTEADLANFNPAEPRDLKGRWVHVPHFDFDLLESTSGERTALETPRAAARGANMLRDHFGVLSWTNCRMAVVAYEMRRRGHKVTAKIGNPTPSAQNADWRLWWSPALGDSGVVPNLSALRASLASQPSGSRGVLYFKAEEKKAHLVNWERTSSGDLIYMDGQSGLPFNFEAVVVSRGAGAFPAGVWRLDNRTLANDEGIIPEGAAERALAAGDAARGQVMLGA